MDAGANDDESGETYQGGAKSTSDAGDEDEFEDEYVDEDEDEDEYREEDEGEEGNDVAKRQKLD